MQVEEFRFVLEDIKSQIKSLPPLQSLLKLTQKTTKKLECLTLYSQMDKREFDLEIEEDNIYSEMSQLLKAITIIKQRAPTDHQIEVISTIIDDTKQKYIRTFDILSKQEDILNQEFTLLQKMLEANQPSNEINQIKELDEYDEDQEMMDIDLKPISPDSYSNNQSSSGPNDKVQRLKKEIDDINKKIAQINNGQGKWFNTDHKDFVKIYNTCKGKDTKIISEGIKVLGMKQAEIMDHLELYEKYLQLEKQKKLASEEYKQIKFFEQEEKRQVELMKEQAKKEQLRLKKEKENQQRLKKKQEILMYRQKKAEQMAKLKK